MFKKIKTDNFYLYSTEVENFFISDFMIKAPGEYVKAYLLALMFAGLGTSIDNESLKRQLGMPSEEIEDCWAYWENLGVIKRVNNDPDLGYDVEFVNLRELIGTATPSERIESELDDKEIAKLYKDIQAATGRMIELRESQEILSWINDLGLSPSLILYCYGYCAQNRKSSTYRYVGTILKDWNKQGIRTVSDAENYLGSNDNRYSSYKAIFNELGFSRNPTAEEKRMMNDWFDKSEFSLDEVLNACKQTIAISNPNLKYVDAVLRNTKAPESKTENVAVKINRIYEEIRAKNEAKTKENRSKVFSQIPRIKDIMKELGEEGLKQSQALVRRDKIALSEIQTKIANLASEKAELLRRAGFDPNITDKIYSCPKCKDTGVLEDGSVCSCYAEKLEELNGKQIKEKN